MEQLRLQGVVGEEVVPGGVVEGGDGPVEGAGAAAVLLCFVEVAETDSAVKH